MKLVKTAVELSDFSAVASYDNSCMVQELGSLVTAFHFNRWLPDFRRGSGSSGGLVLPAWLSKSSLNVQLGVGFFSPLPNKTFLKIILLYLNYEK